MYTFMSTILNVMIVYRNKVTNHLKTIISRSDPILLCMCIIWSWQLYRMT